MASSEGMLAPIDAQTRVVTLRKKFDGDLHRPNTHSNAYAGEDQRLDALLQHMAGKDVPSVRYVRGQYIPDFKDPVLVSDGIRCEVVELLESRGDPSSLTIRLSSTSKTVGDIRRFIEECHQMYRMNVQNRLGTGLYVFEQCTFDNTMNASQMPNTKRMMPPKLRFSRHPFASNRTLDTVFHDKIRVVKHRLSHFMHNKDWYEKKGIPHTFGLLLHEIQGAGKTSLIKVCNRSLWAASCGCVLRC